MQNYDFNGRVAYSLTGRVWLFGSVLELLNVIRRQIERYGALRSTCRERTWSTDDAPPFTNEGDGYMPPNGKQEILPGGAPTFLVRVQYCQGATWQGTIQWIDTGRTAAFRSTLELIHLMEQAVAKQLPMESQDIKEGWSEP